MASKDSMTAMLAGHTFIMLTTVVSLSELRATGTTSNYSLGSVGESDPDPEKLRLQKLRDTKRAVLGPRAARWR